ncbi:MAG: hypothetical protein JNJ54_13355 [Myxococcaceae bacterium]|nr:hypothetical protein [Myxococcaceae bacterium]
MVFALLPLALAAAPLDVALLSKDAASSTLEVRWQPLTSPTLAEPFAALPVHPDETFRGVVLPGTRTVAVVRVPALVRDPSFAATLSLVTPDGAERVLATGLARASKPVLVGARLFVERGRAGAPSPTDYRVDELTVSEVDVLSGRLRTVYETKGLSTHLAGAVGRELVLYVAGPQGAKVEAVHVDTLAVRTLVPALPPMAHDFTVDVAGKAVLFTVAEPGVERWFVERVELATGRQQRLAEGDTVALLPTVLPGGVAYQRAPGEGLVWAGREGVALPSRGPGFERVRFVVEGLVFARHETADAAPVVTVTRVKDLGVVSLAQPTGAIVDVAGVAR